MIKKGFEKEIIDGYEVSEKTKKIWYVELDLLRKFIQVCEENDIKYYLADGSLLGAVRHKGFIPWDNDIDIAVPRKDYNRLLKIAQAKFVYPYFFQSSYSDKYYLRFHSQLRNTNTTAILDAEKGVAKFNQGIFIDIFPLDCCAPNIKLQKKLDRKIKFYNALFSYIVPSCRESKKVIGIIHSVLLNIISLFFIDRIKHRIFAHADKILSLYSNSKSKLSYNFWISSADLPYNVFVNSNGQNSFLEFEGIKVAVPFDYQKYLKIKFGDDYMIPKKGGDSHGEVFFDPENSYVKYVRRRRLWVLY